MQLEYAEKEDSYVRGKEVCLHLPAKIVNSPHREAVIRISDTTDGTFIVCSQDGSVSFWTSTLELKRSRTVVVSALLFSLFRSKQVIPFPTAIRKSQIETEMDYRFCDYESI